MNKPLLALLLLIPAPSIGTAAAMMIWPDKPIGQIIFFVSKVWILALPLVWHLKVNREKPSLSRPRRGGFLVSTLLGIGISIFVVISYNLAIGRLIDPEPLKETMATVGMDDVRVYLGLSAYWILVNAVLEEYVWRWFVVQECEKLMGARKAIFFSAFAFTIHHIVALQNYFNPLATGLCSLGIFVGGAIWSWCYIRYRSIWPGYVSHAIVDVAVFGVGYVMIFG